MAAANRSAPHDLGDGLRLPLFFSVLALIVSAALAAYAWTGRPPPAAETAQSGIDVLRAYRCKRGETKQIILRGVEDNHSPAGSEANFIRPGRQSADVVSFFTDGSYDQVQADRRVTDSFMVPARTANGLFLLRLRPVAGNANDTFAIGDMRAVAITADQAGRASGLLSEWGNRPGWTQQGELHFAGLDSIRLNRIDAGGTLIPGGNLLDLIRSGATGGWVDFLVQDDTSVDFAGLALCLEPENEQGITLARFAGPKLPDGTIALACGMPGPDQPICDPYVGDTPCAAALPLACIRPDDRPAPAGLRKMFVRGLWSGGTLAFTEPVRGNSFATYHDADAHCAARFGPEWRIARLHDGTDNQGVAGYSSAPAPAGRVWIDLAGSPHATCWAR